MIPFKVPKPPSPLRTRENPGPYDPVSIQSIIQIKFGSMHKDSELMLLAAVHKQQLALRERAAGIHEAYSRARLARMELVVDHHKGWRYPNSEDHEEVIEYVTTIGERYAARRAWEAERVWWLSVTGADSSNGGLFHFPIDKIDDYNMDVASNRAGYCNKIQPGTIEIAKLWRRWFGAYGAAPLTVGDLFKLNFTLNAWGPFDGRPSEHRRESDTLSGRRWFATALFNLAGNNWRPPAAPADFVIGPGYGYIIMAEPWQLDRQWDSSDYVYQLPQHLQDMFNSALADDSAPPMTGEQFDYFVNELAKAVEANPRLADAPVFFRLILVPYRLYFSAVLRRDIRAEYRRIMPNIVDDPATPFSFRVAGGDSNIQ